MIPALPHHLRHEVEKHREKDEKHKARDQGVSFFELITLANCFPCSLVFATDRLEDRINPIGESALVVTLAKARVDTALANVERGNVWQRAFQSVADLNRGLAIGDENEQDDAVALVLLPNGPGVSDPLAIGGNVIVALHFWKHGDHNLV